SLRTMTGFWRKPPIRCSQSSASATSWRRAVSPLQASFSQSARSGSGCSSAASRSSMTCCSRWASIGGMRALLLQQQNGGYAAKIKIDLLFYHFRLHCFVIIDLKMTSFKPEYAGKMNFYLSAVDDLLRHAADQPSIGIVLCKSHNE